jgi:hypothetical protein
MYSFTKPRKKEAFSYETKLLFALFHTTLMILLIIEFVLNYKIWTYQDKTKDYKTKNYDLKLNIKKNKNKIFQINEQKILYDDLMTNNLFLKDSIKNLFDLVPDKITLESARMSEKKLILKGITPTKEVYKYLLLAPLESIFHHTYTSYYQQENGWFMFESTSTLELEEETNE